MRNSKDINKQYINTHKKISVPAFYVTNILFLFTILFGLFSGIFNDQTFYLLQIIFGTLLLLYELRQLTVYWSYVFVFLTFIGLIQLLKILLDLTVPINLTGAIATLVLFTIDASLAYALITEQIKPLTVYFIFYSIACYFIYCAINFIDPNTIVEGSSQNSMSMYMIAVLMPLIFLYKQKKISAPLLPSIICLILSIYGIGRSGIISSSLIFIAIFFSTIKFDNIKNLIKIIFKNFMILTAIVMIIFYKFIDIFAVYFDTSFLYYLNKGFESEARAAMLREYLDNIGVLNLVLGQDLTKLNIISEFSANPHNYLIALHSRFGIIAILMILMIISHTFIELKRRNIAYVMCIIAFLFRASTDSGLALPFVFLTLAFFSIKNVSHISLNKPNTSKFTLSETEQ